MVILYNINVVLFIRYIQRVYTIFKTENITTDYTVISPFKALFILQTCTFSIIDTFCHDAQTTREEEYIEKVEEMHLSKSKHFSI